MCGFAGFIDWRRQTSSEDLGAMAMQMAELLRHRGPDDSGVWVDAAAGVALGHRRLSVLDLSPAGHQPMISESGRYVLVFNGEIYNHPELREQLQRPPDAAPAFRGHSDTEVMLACFERWGIPGSVARFNGMFAFAVWDRKEHILYLGRDRLGEKPLYFGRMSEVFVFGSELKSLRAHPSFRSEINREALALYLRHNCIPAPHSIYRGIAKLPPATLLKVTSQIRSGATTIRYWSLHEAAESGVVQPLRGAEPEILEQMEWLVRDAVGIRMVADVPLGVFLSGGVDSSTVTALMQAQSSRPIRTFSVGVHEAAYDEAKHAAAVARHLGTEHTEVFVTPAEALAAIPKMPTIYDEPFSDSSQIPSFLIAQMARGYVTVALSGDGGDEIFGGYNRHVWSTRIWKAVGWVPRPVRSAAAAAIMQVRPQDWDLLFHALAALLPESMRVRTPGYKLHKLAGTLAVPDLPSLYRRLASHWTDPSSVVIGAEESPTLLTAAEAWPRLPEFAQQMMFLDALTYLPDDILTKVDRASMAVSLELRVPYLDHRLVEFAWRIPVSMKIRNGQGKWILRQLLYRYVPPRLVDRPKSGFGIPLDRWLRGPLRDWSESLLDTSRLRKEGFFNPSPIRQKWEEHLSGKHDWQEHLWDVLMFQAWLQEQRQALPSTASSAIAHC